MELGKQHCVACQEGAEAATDREIRALRAEIPEWKLIGENGVQKLQRQFSFPDFVTAMAFTQRVAELAEAEGHHPALLTEWGKVTVTWWTHKLDGLHQNDFICAARTDALIE